MNFELVYTSVLAPTADVLGFADTIRRARSYIREHGITGILVFDGERFCQYLEGERQKVLELVAKIEADPRHHQFVVLHQATIGPRRRFGDWHMAYALDTQGAVLEAVANASGSSAAALLLQRVPELEFQSSTA